MALLKNVPLDVVLKRSKLALKSISTRFKYKDGEKTDTVEGIIYSVVDLISLNAFSVVVDQRKPIIDEDQVDELGKDEENRVFVKFVNAVVTPYLSRSKSLEESIKADNVVIVEEDSGEEVIDI